MKILGFEVNHYGVFADQFVPLSPGVCILTGLNNAGKTSLLRALFSLSSSPELPYVHPGNKSRINLIYSLEPKDLELMKPPNYASFLTGHPHEFARVKFHFVNPRFDGIDVVSADGKIANWIRQIGAQMQRVQFDSAGVMKGGQPIGAMPNNIQDINRHVPGIEKFAEIIYVPARREGADSAQATANNTLPVNGNNIASYLSTLQLNETDNYEALNAIFCANFPYLRRVNAQVVGSNVEVRVTYKDSGKAVPLSACGSGVAQLLILLTCIMQSAEDAIIAIDEPHSFLHPAAEKAFVHFLQRYPKKTILLATHSAIMINSVAPDRVLYISPSGSGTEQWLKSNKNRSGRTPAHKF